MNFFQFLFGFSGRINRAKYWLAGIIYTAIFVAVGFVAYAIATDVDMDGKMLALLILLMVVIFIPVLISSIAVCIKRLHDRDKSAWWLLVFYLLPFVFSAIAETFGDTIGIYYVFELAGSVLSIWGLVVLGFLRGTAGPNKYGADPLASSTARM